MPRITEAVDIKTVSDLIAAASESLFGIIVAEPGDLYNIEVWRARSILGRDFKYPETLAERTAIELAHHISLAGRRLISNREDASASGADDVHR